MKTQTFLIRCEYPDGDHISTQEFVENIQEYFAANIMDGERGRLVVKPVYQPKEGLVEEENKPKFKVGDRVKWYNHTCNITSIATIENTHIYLIKHNDYREDKTFAKWVSESELTFEDDCKNCGLIHNSTRCLFMDNCPHNKQKTIIEIPKDCVLKDEQGNVINATKIVLEKRNKYPKTYEECCEVLVLNSEITDSELLFYYPQKCGDYTTIRLPEMEKFEKFIQLYLCRNAYWKIAGEEMGLGKPWEPDGNPVYAITRNDGCIVEMETGGNDEVFEFPTPEMRDAFKENFDPDIEFCKELL